MTYISYKGLKVWPVGAKWALLTAIAALISLIVALIADRALHNPEVALYGFIGARLLLAVAIILPVPGIVIPLGLLLLPFGIAVFGATHDRAIWLNGWFWGVTAVCEIAGGFALAWFGRKYDKRKL